MSLPIMILKHGILSGGPAGVFEFVNNQLDGVSYDMNVELDLHAVVRTKFPEYLTAGTQIPFPVEFIFDADTVFNNGVVIGGSFSELIINNSGILAGRGGDGAGSNVSASSLTEVPPSSPSGTYLDAGDDGSPAITVATYAPTSMTIINSTTGFIAGGGGGGSGGFLSMNTGCFSDSCQISLGNRAVQVYNILAGGGGWNGGNGGDSRWVRAINYCTTPGSGMTKYSADGGTGVAVTGRTTSSDTAARGGAGVTSKVGGTENAPTLGFGGGAGATGFLRTQPWDHNGDGTLDQTGVGTGGVIGATGGGGGTHAGAAGATSGYFTGLPTGGQNDTHHITGGSGGSGNGDGQDDGVYTKVFGSVATDSTLSAGGGGWGAAGGDSRGFNRNCFLSRDWNIDTSGVATNDPAPAGGTYAFGGAAGEAVKNTTATSITYINNGEIYGAMQ